MAALGDPLADVGYALLYWGTKGRPTFHASQGIADLEELAAAFPERERRRSLGDNAPGPVRHPGPRGRGRGAPVYDEILYEVDDPVATITLDRPDSLNAWTNRMGSEVRHAVGRAERDPAVVGIVITGAGRAFCAGADMNLLTSITEGGATGEGTRDDLEVPPLPPGTPADLDGTYTWLMAGTKPVIAAINGAVAGMAVPIALCCDIRFMADDAVLLTAFAQRGLIAEWGLSWLLTRLAGPAVALDLLMSSRKVTGEECARLGLVNASLPAGELLSHSRRYLEDIAARCSPASLAVMKRQVYSQLHAGLGPAERESQRLMLESFGRPDFKEGVQSFLGKRPPSFARLGEG
ncbi:MAG: enoyl-CoA hydratase/isomerase family protein [Acidimicrobiia bacterium]|nr:enoyl-CoA hydratase/isomerase family protein [Acidimicrobiia bacterium]